jgi:hypothetical protein
VSDREKLQKLDFEAMSAAEIAAAKQEIRKLTLPLDEKPTRRFRTHPSGRVVDLRATLRQSLRLGGDILKLEHKQRVEKPPPLVVLCDISGSMARYAQILLHFLHAVTNERDRVHSFLFGTRLTNVTRHLRQRDVDAALAAAGAEAQDWSGGTRISACLREFNQRWARRVLGSQAHIVVRPPEEVLPPEEREEMCARFDTLEIGTLTLDVGATQRVQAWTVQLTGGATLLQRRGDDARPSLRPTGALELVRPSRAVAITVAASRRLQAAFGFGQAFLTDVASVRLSHARPRSWSVSVAADASQNVDPAAPDVALSFTSLTAELQRPIAGGLSLALLGYARQRVQGQTFSNSGVSLAARFDPPR